MEDELVRTDQDILHKKRELDELRNYLRTSIDSLKRSAEEANLLQLELISFLQLELISFLQLEM